MYDNINDTYDTAIMVLSTLNEETAEKYLLEQLASCGHESAKWHAYLSKVYLRTDRPEMALQEALESVKIQPDYAYGLARAAYAYVFLNDAKNALKYGRKALKFCGDNYIIIRILISLFNYCGKYKECDNLLKKLENLECEAADFYYTKACVYYNLEEYEMGLENMLKARDLGYSNQYDMNLQLADLYFMLGDYNNALKHAQIALKIYDDDYDVYYQLAKIYVAMNKNGNLLKTLKKCVAHGYQDEFIYGGMALAAYNMKKYHKALEYVNQALIFNKDTAANNFMKCQILTDMDKTEAALEACKKAIEANSSVSEFYTKCSYLYTNLKDYNKALKYANIAIAVNPDDSYAYYLKGFVLSRFGQYTPAIEAFQRVIKMDPTDPENFEDICECYALVENYKKLLEYANTGLMLNKDNPVLLYYKAQALTMLGEPKKAVTIFKKLLDIDSANACNFVAAAYCYSQLGMWHECLEYSNQAIMLDRKNAEAFYLKGCAFQNLDRPAEAKKMFEKADILTSV